MKTVLKKGLRRAFAAFSLALALAFNVGLYFWKTSSLGPEKGTEVALQFLTGYLIEKSLSVDNVFVFLLLFTFFRVPAHYQHRVLFWGIIGALIFRGAFIAVGALLFDMLLLSRGLVLSMQDVLDRGGFDIRITATPSLPGTGPRIRNATKAAAATAALSEVDEAIPLRFGDGRCARLEDAKNPLQPWLASMRRSREYLERVSGYSSSFSRSREGERCRAPSRRPAL